MPIHEETTALLETEEDIALFLEMSRLCDDPELLRDAEVQAARARARLRSKAVEDPVDRLLEALHRAAMRAGSHPSRPFVASDPVDRDDTSHRRRVRVKQ